MANLSHSNGHNYHHYSNQKSYSDGSDRDEYLDPASGSTGDYDDDQASSSVGSSLGSSAHGVDSTIESDFMPLVSVQSKAVRLDRVSPKLISMMTDSEKDYYINVCRQLYTELYEI